MIKTNVQIKLCYNLDMHIKLVTIEIISNLVIVEVIINLCYIFRLEDSGDRNVLECFA